LDYDAIPYIALAEEMRREGGKAEAYPEFASKVEQRLSGVCVGLLHRADVSGRRLFPS
jgi:hypothetical protein